MVVELEEDGGESCLLIWWLDELSVSSSLGCVVAASSELEQLNITQACGVASIVVTCCKPHQLNTTTLCQISPFAHTYNPSHHHHHHHHHHYLLLTQALQCGYSAVQQLSSCSRSRSPSRH